MEFVLLLLSAILIARYVKKRSPAITICHIFFFVVLLYLSLFTTEFAPVAQLMKRIFGMEYYYVREAMCEPCIWIYSTNFAIFIIELALLIFLHIYAIVFVAKKIFAKCGKEPLQRAKPNIGLSGVFVRCFKKEQKIYLSYCRLLI